MAIYKHPKGSKSILTEQEKTYVKMHANKNDVQIANHLQVNKSAVTYYRKDVLNIIRMQGRPRRVINRVIPVPEIEEEITALQLFANYPSLMNGAHARMKYLLQLRDGIRA